jgi:hypothetical protein
MLRASLRAPKLGMAFAIISSQQTTLRRLDKDSIGLIDRSMSHDPRR